MERDRVIETLNRILELELAGVVRSMHYSLMVFGRNRIPIVSWFRDEATQS
ncbi:MAG: bacterioferritin, partial [Gammaproteobacteria bacterium]|nr:bacterioferritin [Gammaproteobacteria bacterium]